MSSLNHRQKLIYIGFAINNMILLITVLGSLYLKIILLKSFKEIGYGNIVWILSHISLGIYLLVKYPHVRPKWKKIRRAGLRVIVCRTIEFYCLCGIMLSFFPLLIQTLTSEINPKIFFNEIILFMSCGAIIYLIEKFILQKK